MPDQKETQMCERESATRESVKGASACKMQFSPVRDIAGRGASQNEIAASDEIHKGVEDITKHERAERGLHPGYMSQKKGVGYD